MVASLLRLFHNGLQDYRLIGKEVNIKSFTYVLVKAGRFTTQWQRLDFDTKPGFGQTGVCKLVRKGHLITRVYLVASMPDIRTPQSVEGVVAPVFGWTNSLVHALIENLQLDIGGARVESMDSRLLEVLDEYYTPLEKLQNVNNLIKRQINGFNEKSFGWESTNTQVVVPLPFWFCKGDLGSALPVDGLYVDDVKVSIKFRGVNGLYYSPSFVDTDSLRVPNVNGMPTLTDAPLYKYDVSGGVVIPGLVPGQPNAKVSKIPGASMPSASSLTLGDTYLLVEYVYLDKPEANRFRQAEFTMPIVQHYSFDPVFTKGQPFVQIPLRVPNPTRHMFFMSQRVEATNYNAYFLSTRDLSGNDGHSRVAVAPWWPDASGLNMETFQPLIPGFSSRDSDPLKSIALLYEGKFVRVSTENTALYRSILPSLEMRKSPFVNRYYYCLPFCLMSGYYPGSVPLGEANLDRIPNITLNLELQSANMAKVDIPQYIVYVWTETYNIAKMFGGRFGLLFGY